MGIGVHLSTSVASYLNIPKYPKNNTSVFAGGTTNSFEPRSPTREQRLRHTYIILIITFLPRKISCRRTRSGKTQPDGRWIETIVSHARDAS